MTKLSRNLDLILEDEPPTGGWHPLNSAMDLVAQLQNVQQTVADIQHKLASLRTRMAAELALSIRRTKPGLNVVVDKVSCKVGYKTKYLQLTPEVENGLWKVTSTNGRFLREFLKAHRRATLMVPDLTVITNAIVDYFGNYYRTLGEELEGTGRLLIEQREATLLDLAAWRNGIVDERGDKPLNSRRAQREAARC